MNAKQIIPVIAKIAPPLLFGVAIYYGLKWLFPDDEKKKPETAPANAENHRKETEIALKTPPFRPIPAKPAIISIPTAPKSFIPLLSVAAVPTIPVTQSPPLPIKKKFVTRGDVATIFHPGARALNRTAAVAALKNLGFGKSAAYDALSPDGRFSAWLQCAPDGIITWKS